MNPIITYEKINGASYITINGRRSKIWDNGNGYLYTSRPKGNGGVGVHRVVMEAHIGRRLERIEHVHHKNGDRTDNRIENLGIINGSVHNSIHTTKRNWKHDPNNFICRGCESISRPHKAHGLCLSCFVKLCRRRNIVRPCKICDLVNKEVGDTCARCLALTYDSCTVCNRTREQLPKSKCAPINKSGVCRACKARIERANTLK